MLRSRILLSVLTGLLFLSCGKSPGEITVTLNDDGINQISLDKIENFLMVVVPQGAPSTLYLYPDTCGGFIEGVNQSCYCGSCGYSRDLQSFQADLSFEFFPKDESFKLYVCGLNGSTVVVAGSSGVVPNTPPQTVPIDLAETTSPSDCSLPAGVCPPLVCPATPTPSPTPTLSVTP